MRPLTVACWSFTATADLQANHTQISKGLHEAAQAGARLVLTPETALCGYPGAARDSLPESLACELGDHEDLLHREAERLGLVLVLGSASLHPQGGMSNDAFVCGDVPVQRYRKRCLTPIDEQHFQPGSSTPTLIDIDDWCVALSICYEVRFPALWGGLALSGADAYVNIAHMAGPDPDPGTKATVVPQHFGSRAAELASPVVSCNTSAADRWYDSAAWDARGMMQDSCGEGLLCVQLKPRGAFADWYNTIHTDALSSWRRLLG